MLTKLPSFFFKPQPPNPQPFTSTVDHYLSYPEPACFHESLNPRDWYVIAEQPAASTHLAHPQGCASLRIVLESETSNPTTGSLNLKPQTLCFIRKPSPVLSTTRMRSRVPQPQTSNPTPGVREREFYRQPSCLNPLYHRDNLVDRPRAMGFEFTFPGSFISTFLTPGDVCETGARAPARHRRAPPPGRPPQSQPLSPKPYTPNPRHQTPDPRPQTPDPRPRT